MAAERRIASATFGICKGFASMRRFAAGLAGGFMAAALLAPTAGAQVETTPPAPTTTAAAPVVEDPERIGDGGIDPPGGPAGEEKPEKGDDGKGNGKGRGKLRLIRGDASPDTAWFAGRPATFRFAIDGRRKRDVVVQIKRKGAKQEIVRRFVVEDVKPRDTRTVDWFGKTSDKRWAPQGTYKFKVRAKHGGPVIAKGASGRARAEFWKHKFPVRGAHTYGDGLGAGRGHRGVDIFAGCGTKMQAARAGVVPHRAFQGSGAGHYLVIDGKGTKKDYVYMHLQHASRFGPGDRVKTGERIGRVGDSGNASGCHLHFELWGAPGWYEGGNFLDPMPRMRAWDRWS
jgi:murein DD-endopeptidase MepM/ murein hydrolase activator NlpD